MKKFLGRQLALLLALILAVSMLPVMAFANEEASQQKKITIHVLGDSTACEYASDQYPKFGVAQAMAKMFNENVTINNQAYGGYTSRKAYNTVWASVKSSLKKGDYLFIQFGHNDPKSGSSGKDKWAPLKEIDPTNVNYQYYENTYYWYMQQFIDYAKAKGATPVILTSIRRLKAFKPYRWTDDTKPVMYDTSDTVDYAAAAREIAEENDLVCIDMFELTAEHILSLDTLGEANELYMYFGEGVWPNWPSGQEDDTHLTEKGATTFASLALDYLKSIDHPLSDYILANEEESDTPTYTFEELTDLTREDIDHIVIRNGLDGTHYSTAYEKIITDIYNAINTKSFLPYVQEDKSDDEQYEIIFFDKNDKSYSYNILTGITPESGFNGESYVTANEELKLVAEKAYNLISNDCSDWSADYIVKAKDVGFLDDVTDIVYKENITREKFCEIVYNMLDRTMDIEWEKVSANPFEDTTNEKVFSLYSEGIINGKGGKTFAPDDILTREESATILYRLAEYMKLDMPQSTYSEDIEYYADKDMISQWAFDAVFYMKEMGIMVGTSDTEFSPKGTYTAEQAIATIIRLYNHK